MKIIDLSKYRLWSDLLDVIDDDAIKAVASGEDYASAEVHNKNYQILKEIVEKKIFPTDLDYDVPDGACIFKYKYDSSNKREILTFLFCSLILIEQQSYDIDTFEDGLIMALDCCYCLSDDWLKKYSEYLNDKIANFGVKPHAIEKIYYEICRLVTSNLLTNMNDNLRFMRHIEALYSSENKYFKKCYGQSLLDLFSQNSKAALWHKYFEKTKLVEWLNNAR
ncbi:hypothetical protein [Methylobacter sp.]|uniref:hypothetical protein n=1 Tax=Methylobacter sp. TaxID=2051955 RepID=UPI003DA3A951